VAFDWNATNAGPFRRRLPYLPDTDVAKWYALAQAAFHGTYLIPVVTWHYQMKGREGRWNGLAGCLFASLN